jgi:hypothetical protein
MGGLSGNPDRRARQLANLRTGGAPAAPEGNRRRVTHGAYATLPHDRIDAKVQAVCDALALDAPLHSAADGAAIRLAAEVLCRIDSVSDYLARRGIENADGQLRVVELDLERRLRAEAASHLESLGMSPRARVALGVSLAGAASDPLEAWQRRRDGGQA